MPRPQFTLRALLVAMLAVGCFFGGIHFERERQRREDEAAKLAASSKASKRSKLIETFDKFDGHTGLGGPFC